MPASDLPPPTRLRPYRLPRKPGAGRVIAPALPFSDPAATLSATGGCFRSKAGQPQVAVITCDRSGVAGLAARLAKTGAAGLRVVIEVDGIPAVTRTEVRTLTEAGVAALEITGQVAVDMASRPAWIELNKAALQYGLPLSWSGQVPEAERRTLVHLVPARNQADWLRRWRYGMLGWRKGPGFAQVIDSREHAIDGHARARELMIDLPVVQDLFGPALDQPACLASGNEETIIELTTAGLVLISGDLVTWLPYRTRRWPVDSQL